MLVSVIMPAYNAAAYIDEAIRSLLRGCGDLRLDIIVVDDGSTDDTRRVVRGAMQQHAEVRLIVAEHAGVSAARNRGLDALPASADFVTFHDADDIAFPGRVARQADRLQADPRLDVVYGKLQLFDVLDAETLLPAATARKATVHGVSLSAGLFRRAVIERTGRFDESLAQAEDTDFLLRMVESGAVIQMEEELATCYRRHDCNTSRDAGEARREFMKAIHKSVQRRRTAGGKTPVPLASGLFSKRSQIEELFETCPSSTLS